MQRKIKKYWVDILLVSLLAGSAVFAASQNYTSGTWLTGWDNLHPEFNLPLNIIRSLSAVWQEYQGLGLLGGMAHASDLPRQLILLILSIFFDVRLLRYIWTFLMLILGPVGVYVLINKLFGGGKAAKLAALTAGSYYLFNLGTVQYFYTVYESFVSFYGFLPWLIYATVRCLKHASKKNLMIVFVLSIIATPAFYVQTMFVVYAIIVGIFVLENLLWSEQKRQAILDSLKLLLIVIAANSFWLLPSIFFTATNAEVVKESKINQFATIETQLMNEDKGNIRDVSLIRGFWFSYSDLGEDGEFQYLMEPWREHLSSDIETIGYVIFGIAVLGALLLIVKRTNWRLTPVIILTTSVFMLMGNNPPTGRLFMFFTENVPLFGQVFRSVFTKWSGAAALAYSIGLAGMVFVISDLFKNRLKLLGSLLAIPIIVTSVWFVKPVFEGELIMPRLRVEIPDEYFASFDHLNEQSYDNRIAFFPMQDFYGWNFYDWGYRGSGFIWYGLKQPVLDRAFDVWSSYDETFYHQASDAFYAADTDRLIRVFDKFDVTKIYIDKSVIVPHKSEEILRTDDMVNMLEQSGAELEFKQGKISIYDVSNLTGDEKWVYSEDVFTNTASDTVFARRDNIYENYGNYVSTSQGSVVFPFNQLYKEKIKVSYSEPDGQTQKVELTADIDQGKKILMVPGVREGTPLTIPVEVRFNNENVTLIFDRHARLYTGTQEIDLPRLPNLLVKTTDILEEVIIKFGAKTYRLRQGETKEGYAVLEAGLPVEVYVFNAMKSVEHDMSEDFGNKELNTCWTREGGDPLVDYQINSGVMRVATRDAVGCTAYKIGDFSETNLFEIELPYQSSNGSRPHFCILAEGEDYNCRNDEIFYNSPYSEDEWSRVYRQLVLEGNKKYWFELSARPPEQLGEQWKISYRSPEIVTYPLAAHIEFNRSIWDEITGGIGLSLDMGEKITGRFIAHRSELNFANRGRLKPYNCDVFERGEVQKLVDTTKIEYTADDYAAVCDHVSMNDHNTDESFLLRLEGEGSDGRAQKLYLYNKANKRVDIEVLLGQDDYDHSYSVLKWNDLQPDNYVINSELRSFGEENTAELDSATFYEFPIEWVSSYYLDSSTNRYFDGVSTDNVSKKGTYLYRSDINSGESGVFVLSQGYNRYWDAYLLPKSGSSALDSIKNSLPLLFGENLTQVKVNGWANGWMVEPTVNSEQVNVNGEESITDNRSPITGHIVIVYWPQYLEYLGLALIPLTFIFFALPGSRKDKTDRAKSPKYDKVLKLW